MNTHTSLRLSRLKRVLAVAGACVFIAHLLPQTAHAAPSWNPTLLVNTESFEQIEAGDGSTDIELRFGTTTKTIKFLTTSKFQFSHSISVLGTVSGSSLNIDHNATVGGKLTASGSIRTLGNFTGSSLTINRNANIGGTLTVTGSITTRSTLSGDILRVSNNAAVHGTLTASGAIRTDSGVTLNDDNDSNNAILNFGNTSGVQSLSFVNASQRFRFTRSLSVVGSISGSSLNVDRNATVGGTLTVTGAITGQSTITAKTILSGNTLRVSAGGADIHGPLAVSGAIRSDTGATINDDADSNNAILKFGNSTANQTLSYVNALQKFQFSKGISVLGSISGSSLNVDRNATVGGTLSVTGATVLRSTLSVSGSVMLEGSLTGATIAGFGLTNCTGANSLRWNSGTSKFECAANASVGNGSGGIISIHPEYPNAIYYSSGSAIVGQLTMSGGTSAFDNSYQWTSSRSTLQDYWVSVRQRLPDNFSSWDPVKPMEFRWKTGTALTADNHLTLRIRDTAGTVFFLTGSLASTNWYTSNIGTKDTNAFTTGTWTPKGYYTVYLKIAAKNTANAQANASYMNFNYETTTP